MTTTTRDLLTRHPFRNGGTIKYLWWSGQALVTLSDALFMGGLYVFIRWGNPHGPTSDMAWPLVAPLVATVLAALTGQIARRLLERSWDLAAGTGDTPSRDVPGTVAFVTRTAAVGAAALTVADAGGAMRHGATWGLFVLGVVGGALATMLCVLCIVRVARRSSIDWVSMLTYAALAAAFLIPSPGPAREIGALVGVLALGARGFMLLIRARPATAPGRVVSGR